MYKENKGVVKTVNSWKNILIAEFGEKLDTHEIEMAAKDLNRMQKAIRKGSRLFVVIDQHIPKNRPGKLVFHLRYIDGTNFEKVWPWSEVLANAWGMKINNYDSGFLKYTFSQSFCNMDRICAATMPFTYWLKKHTGMNIQLSHSDTI